METEIIEEVLVTQPTARPFLRSLLDQCPSRMLLCPYKSESYQSDLEQRSYKRAPGPFPTEGRYSWPRMGRGNYLRAQMGK